jgi:hypothetical protein
MDAAQAAHDAAIAALLVTDAVSVPVFSTVPPDAAWPLVVLADLTGLVPIGRSEDPDRRGTMTVLTITEASEKESCIAYQAEVNGALSGKTLTVEDWSIAIMLEQQSTELDEEGAGYVGTNQFSFIALKD